MTSQEIQLTRLIEESSNGEIVRILKDMLTHYSNDNDYTSLFQLVFIEFLYRNGQPASLGV